LKKNANILVIGPDNAGKTSLINSLDYMVRKKDGNQTWRSAASYDLGKKYKFKQEEVIAEVSEVDSVAEDVAAGAETVGVAADVEPVAAAEKMRKNGFPLPNLDALLKMAKSKA